MALLNRSSAPGKISAHFNRLGLRADSVRVRDLWDHADRGAFGSQYQATVPAHGVVLVRITPIASR